MMYFIWIYRIISIIYWTNFYVFARDSNRFLPEKQYDYDHRRSLPTGGENNNQKQNKSSMPVMLRMIAFRIRPIEHDDRQQSAEITEQTQRNIRLLLLPLIIRMLLAKIANQSNRISTTKINQIVDRNDKLNCVYGAMRKFINLSNELTTIEKLMLIGFVFVTFFVIIFSIYSIKRRLKDFAKLRTMSIDQKLNDDEIEKLLE